jgi:hypothetical protein
VDPAKAGHGPSEVVRRRGLGADSRNENLGDPELRIVRSWVLDHVESKTTQNTLGIRPNVEVIGERTRDDDGDDSTVVH